MNHNPGPVFYSKSLFRKAIMRMKPVYQIRRATCVGFPVRRRKEDVNNMFQKAKALDLTRAFCSEGGNRTPDLRVMNPTL